MKSATRGSTRTLFAIAFVAPLAMGVFFVPIFRWVQTWNYPQGSLQGIDLTRFARRDEWMFRAFELALFLVVIAVGLLATSWRSRLIILVAGTVAAVISYVVVFASLFAG